MFRLNAGGVMRDSNWLQERFESVRKWLHEVAFGRLQATEEQIGRTVHLFGTIKRLLGKG
jgi:hypothetical protein